MENARPKTVVGGFFLLPARFCVSGEKNLRKK